MTELSEIVTADQITHLGKDELKTLVKAYGGRTYHLDSEKSLRERVQQLSLAAHSAKLQDAQNAAMRKAQQEAQAAQAEQAAAAAKAAEATLAHLEAQPATPAQPAVAAAAPVAAEVSQEPMSLDAPTVPEPEADLPAWKLVDQRARIERLTQPFVARGLNVRIDDDGWHFTYGNKSDSGHVSVSDNLIRLCAQAVMGGSKSMDADGLFHA